MRMETESLNARCEMLDPRCMVMGMQRWENDLFVYVHMGVIESTERIFQEVRLKRGNAMRCQNL